MLLVVLLGEAALMNNSVGWRGEVGDEKTFNWPREGDYLLNLELISTAK